MPRLEKKVAIITGAAQGIGAATAELFAQEGAAVVIADIDEAAGREEAAKINAAGYNATYFNLDVTSRTGWEECVSFTARVFGKLNILVNNAGISHSKNIADTSDEVWDRTIATNQTSIFYGMQTAIDTMRQSGESCAIANASSIDGLVGESRFFAYCAAKGAVTMMTKAAALYCAENDLTIRVNSVHPGYILTPMASRDAEQHGQTPEEYTKQFVDRHPVGHLGDPANIANGYLYLCSDDAAFVTGTQLAIDGGFTAQ
ncbi:SDR family NAD(P)-dependent oxidoreductase [Arthrobacter castelli]|uniref:SDR family NAD(P)-dependent oxidoreductase n=1 Tax=Arthrobacter castelli TaxID=271431 RepID=UPI000400A79A|nr:glucose 1-dehydrogenase [Arthrobacter castelli]